MIGRTLIRELVSDLEMLPVFRLAEAAEKRSASEVGPEGQGCGDRSEGEDRVSEDAFLFVLWQEPA